MLALICSTLESVSRFILEGTAMTKNTTGQGRCNIPKWDYLQVANLRMDCTDSTYDTWNRYKHDFLCFMRKYADMNRKVLQEVHENYLSAQ